MWQIFSYHYKQPELSVELNPGHKVMCVFAIVEIRKSHYDIF